MYMKNPRLEYLNDKTKKLTEQSGCYLMKDKKDTIIYVGKAKNLKKRVSSYFRLHSMQSELKVQKMVDNVYDYDYVVTSSEFEALVLECSLIKLHKPKYNILLKDDKGYHYIKVTGGSYGRIIAAMQKVDDGSVYIGPFLSSFAVTTAVEEANRAFLLPDCNRKFPRDFGKQRPCLNYYIKQCMGVCKGNISQEEYFQTLEEALRYIKEDSAETLKRLSHDMEQAAENLEFEKAAKIRDRINAINRINEKQKVVFTSATDQDVVGMAVRGSSGSAVLLKFRKGRLVDKVDHLLGEIDSLDEAREEFIQYYYTSNPEMIPKRISIDGPISDMELTMRLFEEKSGKSVKINIPQKGEGKRLSEMAVQNAEEIISFSNDISAKELAVLNDLGRMLGLKRTPLYIESYDISNMGSSNMVAGMIVYENARPNKKQYKRFAIKEQEGQDDYGAMKEVIRRRLSRYVEEQDSDEGFGKLPDLILLDGGKGHVSSIVPIVEEFELDIPVFGMVKDNRHRTRALVSVDGEIELKLNRSAYTFVYKMQEEVHRFAIAYQRTLHKRSTFSTSLTKIEGIGETRAKNLLRHFKTIRAISMADVDRLREVKGMSEKSAHNVYSYFHSEKALESEKTIE